MSRLAMWSMLALGLASAACSSDSGGGGGKGGAGGAGGMGAAGTGGVEPLGGGGGSGGGPTGGTAPACTSLDLTPGTPGPGGEELLFDPEGFAADVVGVGLTATHVYFQSEGALRRIPLAGGVAEPVGTLTKAVLVHADRIIWFADNGTELRDLTVAPTSDPTATTVVAPGITASIVTADGSAVYYVGGTPPSIYRAPYDGTGPTALVAANVAAMVANQGYVYYLDRNGDVFRRVPVTGGPAQDLDSFFWGGVMDAEGSTVVWGDFSESTISEWHEGATQRTVLANTGHFDDADDIVVHGNEVLWVAGGFGCNEVFAVALTGGTQRRATSGFRGVDWIADDGTHLYLAGESLWRVPLH